jgi:hypothetical protein
MPIRPAIRPTGAVVAASVFVALSLTWAFRGPVTYPRRTMTAPNATPSALGRTMPAGLDALNRQSFAVSASGRDPFSFRPRPAVLRDAPAASVVHIDTTAIPRTSYIPAPAALPFKFMGILQKGHGDTWAIFADCAGYTRAGRVGDSILGVWRVVHIGVEAVDMEAFDGRRATLPEVGCGPR